MRRLPLVAGLVALAAASAAHAWTRPGHMVTAAIAWDDLQRRRPELLPVLAGLLDAQPDRGPFEVAADRSTGLERSRRMFLECARWPDDVRQTPADRPSWHLAVAAAVTADAPAEARAAAAADKHTGGEALDALALNLATLSDAHASAAERSVALCWTVHVLGDMHQPLHTATLYSKGFPQGDFGGGGAQVRDPLGGQVVSLHWLWDDAVNRSGRVEDVDRRAAELEARLPRAEAPELSPGFDLRAGPPAVWRETHARAEAFAAGLAIPMTPSKSEAPALSPEAWARLHAEAERRVTLAGYRIADALIAALGASATR